MNDISEEEYRRIEARIRSDDSPVGIDAAKTHVLILHRLESLAKRLEALEDKLDLLERHLGEPSDGPLPI